MMHISWDERKISGISNPALLLLEVVNRHRKHGGSLEADRESFMRCGEKCSSHEDLEGGDFVMAEDIARDIRLLACMGRFRVTGTDGVLTLEKLED